MDVLEKFITEVKILELEYKKEKAKFFKTKVGELKKKLEFKYDVILNFIEKKLATNITAKETETLNSMFKEYTEKKADL